MTLEGEDRVAKIIEVARNAKAHNMVQFDVRGKSVLTDYVLICEARSQAHGRGVCERVHEGLKELGVRPEGLEGEREGNWILMASVMSLCLVRETIAITRIAGKLRRVGKTRV